MRRTHRATFILAAALTVALCAGFASAREWTPLVETAGADAPPSARVVTSGPDGTTIRVEVPGFAVERGAGRRGVSIALPGTGRLDRAGLPDLPALSYYVAIPRAGSARLEIVSVEEAVLGGYDVAPAAPFRTDGEPAREVSPGAAYDRNALYPEAVAVLDDPVVFRDLRLARVEVRPVRANPVTGELHVATDLTLRVVPEAGPTVNGKEVVRSWRSATFEPFYQDLVLNYDELPRAETRRGSYLVIANDSFAAASEPLVEWKTRRGIETVLVTLSDIDPTPSAADIHAYIQTAYLTWDNPPDYVLLVGDAASGGYGNLPTWYHDGNPADHPYGELEGTDYLPEVIVGRIPTDSPSETAVAVMKVLEYERDCGAADQGWYERALAVAGNYGASPPPVTPRLTTLRVREMKLDYGYSQVDTVYYPPVTSPDPISDVINAGVGAINYRGWGGATGWYYPEFLVADINALSNGTMLPIMTSCVCGTGNFDGYTDPAFGEAWIRAGSPVDLKGGPAFYGPSEFWTHTKWNNAVDGGFYDAMLLDEVDSFGQATLASKLCLIENFPQYASSDSLDEFNQDVDFYFNVYNVLGDPELQLRTRTPDSFAVSHDASVPLGQNMLDVTVTDGAGEPVVGAEVVVWKDGELHEARTLQGGTTVQMPLSGATAGDVDVTVWARDFKPYTGTATIAQDDVHVGWYAHAIDDNEAGPSHGNGDGVVNPGEIIEIDLTLRNYGTTTASGVVCHLVQPVEGTTDEESYGDLPAGATSTRRFDVEIPESLDEGDEYVLGVVAEGGRAQWRSELRLVIGAPVLSLYSATIGGDGVIDPGETVTLTVALSNAGSLDATSVTGALAGPVSGVTVGDGSGTWGTITAGSMGSNGGDMFSLTAAPDVAIGHDVTLTLDLEGDWGLGQFVMVPVTVGVPTTSSPLGPDDQGYYAYDDTDAGYTETPIYSWIELDPSHGGTGNDLGLGNDESANVTLPFTFTYYGEDYTELGICSNGWAALGGVPEWEYAFWNWTIPYPLGPDAMVAPFWDDIDPVQHGGKVLTKDLGDGRFVVEWSRAGVDYAVIDQTFQIVFYDPAVYPTATGDGEILFQYYEIHNTHWEKNFSTVGIENADQTGGLLYSHCNVYPDEAAPLADGRAILFTTDPPDGYPSTDVPESDAPRVVTLSGASPNPFNPVTTIGFGLPEHGEVALDVFDVSGRLVRTLVRGERDAGRHRVVWDGTSAEGSDVASGVYFCRLSALGETRRARMVLLK
ncbi:MAG: hypothetical protein GF405_03545 [Candidatus Eisenbacteria bacterium]|nr:hypothetical protein [Candidatus Eisenbacteria bacterium]